MKDFVKKVEDERVPEPTPEEGKELTDEQKKQIIESRQAENLKLIKEQYRLVNEAPKYTFNSNVFKTGVTLDMTEKELKEEEENVEKLSTYIIDTTIPALIGDLK